MMVDDVLHWSDLHSFLLFLYVFLTLILLVVKHVLAHLEHITKNLKYSWNSEINDYIYFQNELQ